MGTMGLASHRQFSGLEGCRADKEAGVRTWRRMVVAHSKVRAEEAKKGQKEGAYLGSYGQWGESQGWRPGFSTRSPLSHSPVGSHGDSTL